MKQFIKSKFNQSVKSGKLNKFFLFLGLSVVFLVLTKLTTEYTKTITFTAVPIHAKENHVILKDVSQNLNMTLRGSGLKLLKYYIKEPEIKIDLSDADVQNRFYKWTFRKGLSDLNKQFGEHVKIMAVNPDSLVFKFDENAIRTIPVELQSNVMYAPGFDVFDSFKCDPDSIKIIGPKVVIDTIDSIKTQKLLLNNVSTNIESTLNLTLPDSSSNVTYSHKKVLVTAHVEKFSEGQYEIPVNVINVPKNKQLNYFPKVVTVKYYTSLEKFKDISKSDFIVECDFNKIDSLATHLKPELVKYPKEVKSVRLVQQQIDFILSR